MKMIAILGKLFDLFERFKNKCINAYYLKHFYSSGKHVYIGKNCIFTPESIILGDNVYIGANCVLQSAHGEIIIGNHVMLGPGVHIHGGNHKTTEIGIYMDQVKKEKGTDGKVVIEDDVWIGSNAIILRGVHVHRGAVIGAGTIVTKDVPPYAIVVGNEGKVKKYRFTDEQITEHENLITKQDI